MGGELKKRRWSKRKSGEREARSGRIPGLPHLISTEKFQFYITG